MGYTAYNNQYVLDEPVSIVRYDPAWPKLFATEQARLSTRLGSAVCAIEHIGSTAVVGLDAKPIVDILVGAQTPESNPEIIESLVDFGYDFLGETGIPNRFYLRKRGEQAFNIHLVIYESVLWKDNLLFRDFLRTNPAASSEYAQAASKTKGCISSATKPSSIFSTQG